jgi:hypothetical protein
MPVTIKYARIIVAFDLRSSSQIMEDLLLNEEFRKYEAFLTCVKRWLIERAKQSPNNGHFDLYKFTGDGWILLFPATTSGKALLDFMYGLCDMVRAELAKHIIPNLSGVPPVLGIVLGVEKGDLVKMTMNKGEEYVGRALNIACKLQNSIKDKESGYKALMSARLYNEYFAQVNVPYKVESATQSLPNILSGTGFSCRKIDFTVDATGHVLSLPEDQSSGWTCARSNWESPP